MSKAAAPSPAGKPAPLPPELWTAEETAAFLRIRVQGVRDLAASGRLAYFRVGRTLRFTREDVAAYLAGIRRETRP